MELTYKKYVDDVLNGNIKVGSNIKLAVERFQRDLVNPKFTFRQEQVERVISFFKLFHHYSGKTAGQPFDLLPWQQFFIANLFGFYMSDNLVKRRFEKSYLQIARKSGKTFLSAALCLYAMLADGEPNAEVLLLATTREQANIAFKMVRALAHQIDKNEKKIKSTKNSIECRKDTHYMKVLSSDGNTLDGYGPNLFLLDEYHAHKTADLYDVMTSGQGNRLNPLALVITTAGFNITGPCKKMRDLGVEILQGIKEDDTQFVMIFEMDEEDDWKNPDNWVKCAPCMNVTITKEYIANNINRAIISPSEATNVKTKILNMWVQSKETWIDNEYIEQDMRVVDWYEFQRENVWIGVDLSSVSDLTSVSFMFKNDEDKFIWKTISFLPEKALEKSENSFIYREAIKNGDLIITPGNVVDYRIISDKIDDLVNTNNMYVDSIAYDKYNATQWALEMQDRGYDMVEYSQSLSSFNRPTKDIERLIMEGSAIIDYSPLVKFCFTNVVLKQDWNGNAKPDKSQSSKKIDNVISMIQCLGGYHVSGNEVPFTFVIENEY